MTLSRKQYYDKYNKISKKYNINLTNKNFNEKGSTVAFWKKQYRDIKQLRIIKINEIKKQKLKKSCYL